MADFEEFRNKKLYRSQVNRMIGGVCGGLAEYFSIDPTIIRLIWVALSLIGGIGIIVYLASLFIIPNNPEQDPAERPERLIRDKNIFWGSLLIILGLFLILKQSGLLYTFGFWHIPWQTVWAFILIGLGGILLYNRLKEDREDEADETTGKRLYRSRAQRMISGVCGGIAEYFEMDVSIIRVLWVIGTIITAGMGVLIYIVMILAIQESPENIKEV
jgi:phage shock protein C